jgi:hypothetical protein
MAAHLLRFLLEVLDVVAIPTQKQVLIGLGIELQLREENFQFFSNATATFRVDYAVGLRVTWFSRKSKPPPRRPKTYPATGRSIQKGHCQASYGDRAYASDDT